MARPKYNLVTDLTEDLIPQPAQATRMSLEDFLSLPLEKILYVVFLTGADVGRVKETDIWKQSNVYCIEVVGELGDSEAFSKFNCFSTMEVPTISSVVELTMKHIKLHHEQKIELKTLKDVLNHESRKLKELNEIGQSLSSISDPQVLMNLILEKSRELTNADAGSICIVKYNNEEQPIEMVFSFFQNYTLKQNLKVDLSMPVSKKSLAGFVALTGECLKIKDAYEIPEEKDYAFNQNVDMSTGYRTKSILVHPMIDNTSTILGVVQLINKRSYDYEELEDGKVNVDQIVEFSPDDVEIISSLTSQAAICLKNTTLIQDIQMLFEGFVNASVTAIEQRDPTTSGHSFRVALMTVELAKALSQVTTGKFAGISYNERELQEVRYASLLHDFGKIGVREQVLVKAKKLYPHEMDMIRTRFEYILKDVEARMLAKKIEMIQSMGYDMANAHFGQLDEELKTSIEEIEEIVYFIIQTNEPSVLEEGNFKRLLEIAERTYLDPYDQPKPFLLEREVEALSIRKGSITADERKEIESHVTHSFTFLSKIPWTRGLKQVPTIAYGHHEWLSGEGYPNQLTEDEILAQSKMMAIADIYDALTASDRPYKKAIPVEKALSILNMEVDRRHLDGELVQLFIDKKVFKSAENY